MSENWNIKDKIVMITGANSGIGKKTARELNRMGAKVPE
jgi:NADP-dependent 3-hydroxy acid dehydrogenase YdfG